MKMQPIDYNSPLGISKREWTRVLGVNLALLLAVYAVALICTLCGSDLFLLNFHSDDLQRLENTLRSWGVYPIVQMIFSTIEMGIVASYIAKAKPKWWHVLSYFGIFLGLDIIFMLTTKVFPPFINNALMIGFWIFGVFALNNWKPQEKWWIYLCRFAIALAMTFILNEGIGAFRTVCFGVWKIDYSNSAFFALSIEYNLALALSLGFLTLLIPWKKGDRVCLTSPVASGSSPSSMNSSPKNSKTAKNNLPQKYMKRLRLLKAKVIAIQTTALIVIAALP